MSNTNDFDFGDFEVHSTSSQQQQHQGQDQQQGQLQHITFDDFGDFAAPTNISTSTAAAAAAVPVQQQITFEDFGDFESTTSPSSNTLDDLITSTPINNNNDPIQQQQPQQQLQTQQLKRVFDDFGDFESTPPLQSTNNVINNQIRFDDFSSLTDDNDDDNTFSSFTEPPPIPALDDDVPEPEQEHEPEPEPHTPATQPPTIIEAQEEHDVPVPSQQLGKVMFDDFADFQSTPPLQSTNNTINNEIRFDNFSDISDNFTNNISSQPESSPSPPPPSNQTEQQQQQQPSFDDFSDFSFTPAVITQQIPASVTDHSGNTNPINNGNDDFDSLLSFSTVPVIPVVASSDSPPATAPATTQFDEFDFSSFTPVTAPVPVPVPVHSNTVDDDFDQFSSFSSSSVTAPVTIPVPVPTTPSPPTTNQSVVSNNTLDDAFDDFGDFETTPPLQSTNNVINQQIRFDNFELNDPSSLGQDTKNDSSFDDFDQFTSSSVPPPLSDSEEDQVSETVVSPVVASPAATLPVTAEAETEAKVEQEEEQVEQPSLEQDDDDMFDFDEPQQLSLSDIQQLTAASIVHDQSTNQTNDAASIIPSIDNDDNNDKPTNMDQHDTLNLNIHPNPLADSLNEIASPRLHDDKFVHFNDANDLIIETTASGSESTGGMDVLNEKPHSAQLTLDDTPSLDNDGDDSNDNLGVNISIITPLTPPMIRARTPTSAMEVIDAGFKSLAHDDDDDDDKQDEFDDFGDFGDFKQPPTMSTSTAAATSVSVNNDDEDDGFGTFNTTAAADDDDDFGDFGDFGDFKQPPTTALSTSTSQMPKFEPIPVSAPAPTSAFKDAIQAPIKQTSYDHIKENVIKIFSHHTCFTKLAPPSTTTSPKSSPKPSEVVESDSPSQEEVLAEEGQVSPAKAEPATDSPKKESTLDDILKSSTHIEKTLYHIPEQSGFVAPLAPFDLKTSSIESYFIQSLRLAPGCLDIINKIERENSSQPLQPMSSSNSMTPTTTQPITPVITTFDFMDGSDTSTSSTPPQPIRSSGGGGFDLSGSAARISNASQLNQVLSKIPDLSFMLSTHCEFQATHKHQ
ncbi:hypothetical protein SAMD00019534_099250 [Acytostelium subglobosum LB1]|uniref:hypothetical protein n=1 Tax=Acytostelium subglobosum LB1 TaxID=1410327 RepID=UPI000644DD8A|nr:hypothetical protein SAMD00019534_099250 [Acytostelium subglobosum LB1]GAM26750.1 hypothetical protein SAMD00019534_099250 [Acytostelium subglobosum LB1]|eukprot:XP_012750411.1 hypothetical protein SAMD00019534_099250 [Acytostelium subglobosum LB1]